jgi:protease I
MNGREYSRISMSLHLIKYAFLLIILAGFSILCWGQYRSRTTAVRIIQLPKAKQTGSMSFEEALAEKRQGLYQLSSEQLDYAQLGQLAWAGQGLIEGAEQPQTQPQLNAAVLRNEQNRPISIYFATSNGLYVYEPDEHSLEQISNQDIRASLANVTSNPEVVSVAGCNVIVTGSVRAITRRYGSEARKVMLLRAGRILEDIQLQAVSLELGIVEISGFDVNGVKRACNLPRTVEPLFIVATGHPLAESKSDSQQSGTATQGMQKKAALIIARQNFRDEELFETQRVLEAGGVQTIIASTTLGTARGMLGGIAEARILIDQLSVDDYDAIVFIGGVGATEYFDNPVALNLAREAAHRGKVLAAISTAPTILAQAGVIRGYRTTSLLTERDRLVQAGAIYTGTPVERDRLIISASGPMASVQFGRLIADALASR